MIGILPKVVALGFINSVHQADKDRTLNVDDNVKLMAVIGGG